MLEVTTNIQLLQVRLSCAAECMGGKTFEQRSPGVVADASKAVKLHRNDIMLYLNAILGFRG
jgi:hypothetical protein